MGEAAAMRRLEAIHAVLGFRVSGFRVQGFRGLGFRDLGVLWV